MGRAKEGDFSTRDVTQIDKSPKKRENERKEFVWSLKWLHFGSQFGMVFQEANKETSSDLCLMRMRVDK